MKDDELILDHARSPRHRGIPENLTCRAEGENPLCGDRLTVALDLQDQRIAAAYFEGSGCAISQASASLMCALLRGKSIAEVQALGRLYRAMLEGTADANRLTALGDAQALGSLAAFPTRRRCATLAWELAQECLIGQTLA